MIVKVNLVKRVKNIKKLLHISLRQKINFFKKI
jgi:hypothetical protein